MRIKESCPCLFCGEALLEYSLIVHEALVQEHDLLHRPRPGLPLAAGFERHHEQHRQMPLARLAMDSAVIFIRPSIFHS